MSFTYTTLASDTFHRANVNPIVDPPWAATGSSPNQILNNELCPTDGECVSIYDGITWPVNQWAQLQIDACVFHTQVGFDYASAILSCRRLDSSNGYALEIDGPLGSSCNVEFFALVAGVTTSFFSGTTTVNMGSIIRLECFGTTISAYIDGVLLESVTDSSLSAAGNVAITTFETASDPGPTNVQMSNFSGGLISQGGGSGGSSGSWLTVNLDNALRGVRH